MDDDDALIAAIAAGNDTALRTLFSRHAPWLAVRLRSVLSASDVEDVLQETFLAAGPHSPFRSAIPPAAPLTSGCLARTAR